MTRLAPLGTLTALLLGIAAWACSASKDDTTEPSMGSPEQTEAPTLPNATNDPPLPPSSPSSPEPNDKNAKDAGASGDAAKADAAPKADGGKPPPPPPPTSCPGKLESEPNDAPGGEYDELGGITCGSISPTDVDHFYVDGKGEPIRWTFEAPSAAKLEVWTSQGPLKTVIGTTATEVITEDRKVFFRVSQGAAVQTYRITLTRK